MLGIVCRLLSIHQIGKIGYSPESSHRCSKAPDRAEQEHLVYAISERTRRSIERQGLLEGDKDNSYLALESAGETVLEGVLGSSNT